jgi:transcriptional regulator with XRE-family HTH domain
VPVLAEFGRRVRAQRQARGWTLEGLAEQAQLDWTYIGSIERGRRNVSLLNILRLAQALGVSVGELADDLEPKKR